MLRTTKKPTDSSFINLSTLNASTLTSQTLSETMQREIDNYTRRLEQDKRKYFRAHENYSEIKRDFDNKNKELEKLKSRKSKTEIMTLRGKISTLEGTLDQTINSYNEALAKNNKLKLEIDEVRKEKKNESQKLRFLNSAVQQITKEIQDKQMQIQRKKSTIQKMKESIIRVKQDNEASMRLHEHQIHTIKNNFDRTGKEEDRKQSQDMSTKSQSIDTQPILKLRLRNLITKNKDKIKIIDQYKRNMHLIYQNFEQIKQESGIQDLEEITKTFIKQEEQNLFIYQYMSRLNSNIESLQQGNAEIKHKIVEQQEVNKERRTNLAGTPEEAKRKRDFQTYKEEKSRTINILKESLEEIKPKIHQLLKEYKLISETEEFDLNQGNVEMYIAQIEQLINNTNISFETVYKSEFKEDITRYTKLPPSVVTDESKEKAEEKLLEKEKLKELAGEFWQKKKALKMMPSKGQQSTDESTYQIK